MAKPDSVYSMFGLKSPQEQAAEEFQRRFTPTRTTDPYQVLGEGFGQVLGALFAPESEAMKQSKMDEALLTSADLDFERQRKLQEAEAKQQQQDLIDQRVGGIEGAIASEKTGELPNVRPRELTAEEQALKGYMDNANRFTFMAERLSAAGRTDAALQARQAAQAEVFKGLQARETIAKTRKAEADAAAKTKKAPTIKEFKIGDEIVTKEYDETIQEWVTLHKAPRYKPTDAASIAAAVYKGSQEQIMDKAAMDYYIESYAENNKAVESARQSFYNLGRMEKLLNSGILTGKFADLELTARQALVDVGIIDDVKVGNTEEFVKTAARQTTALLASGVFGTAQSITDNDRKFAEGMAGGDITITEQSVRTLLDINKYYASLAFRQQRDNVRQVHNAFKDSTRVRDIFEPAYYDGEKFNSPTYGLITWDQKRRVFLDQNGQAVRMN
jgi:hypothetical protein